MKFIADFFNKINLSISNFFKSIGEAMAAFKAKIVNQIRRFKNFLLSFDLIHYYAYKSKDRRALKNIKKNNSVTASQNLIQGLGGEKNLMSVKHTIYGLRVTFKSSYLINRELIDKSGGMDIRIVDKCLYSVFDSKETKMIAKQIKSSIKECRNKHTPLDLY